MGTQTQSGSLLLSARMIANETGKALHQVQWCIRTLRIEPAKRFGNIRVFDCAACARIRQALRETAKSTGEVVGAA